MSFAACLHESKWQSGRLYRAQARERDEAERNRAWHDESVRLLVERTSRMRRLKRSRIELRHSEMRKIYVHMCL
ncbi:MAG: hypothetical protein IJO13_04625, partial [Lachnospiraceae bacterium]|nr:hypothetical protein [Lachnospiraceae bacterium]